MRYEQRKHDGSLPIVGVNTFLAPQRSDDVDRRRPGAPVLELARGTEEEKQSQLARLADFHERHRAEAETALARAAIGRQQRGECVRGTARGQPGVFARTDHRCVLRGRRRLPAQHLARSSVVADSGFTFRIRKCIDKITQREQSSQNGYAWIGRPRPNCGACRHQPRGPARTRAHFHPAGAGRDRHAGHRRRPAHRRPAPLRGRTHHRPTRRHRRRFAQRDGLPGPSNPSPGGRGRSRRDALLPAPARPRRHRAGRPGDRAARRLGDDPAVGGALPQPYQSVSADRASQSHRHGDGADGGRYRIGPPASSS